MSFAFWASEVSGNANNGGGTVVIGDWGIPIFTAQEFYDFATKSNSVLTDQYYLHNDIDFTGFTWTYNSTNNQVIFRGTLNGNGKKLMNLTITNSSTSYLYNGIFPRSIGSTIYDLTLENVHTVTNLSGSTQRAGLLIGRAEGGTTTLSDIKIIDSSVQGNSTNGVGGLVGNVLNSTTIVNISNIKATNFKIFNDAAYVGGLVGRIATLGAQVNVTDVDFQGEVYSNITSNTGSSYAGGIIGYIPSGGRFTLNRSIIEATFQNTLVTSSNFNGYTNRYLGGVIGGNASATANVNIQNMFFTGSLYTRIDARRNDVGTISGQDSTQATTSNVFHSMVAYRALGGAVTYTTTTQTGQMAVRVNASTMPDQAWWNSFYTNFTSNSLWLQDGTGRPYLNL